MTSVGDKIVAERRERLQQTSCKAGEADAIIRSFAPRSMSNETWPPTTTEIAEYDRKSGRVKAKEAG